MKGGETGEAITPSLMGSTLYAIYVMACISYFLSIASSRDARIAVAVEDPAGVYDDVMAIGIWIRYHRELFYDRV